MSFVEGDRGTGARENRERGAGEGWKRENRGSKWDLYEGVRREKK